jgi:hypothetical protein
LVTKLGLYAYVIVLTSKPYLIVFRTLFVIKCKKLFILFDIFLTTRCLFLDVLWGVFVGLGGDATWPIWQNLGAVCGGWREPAMLLLKNQQGWWPTMEPAVLLLGCFSPRDRFWRSVHWIMLRICDKYTQIRLFPKESSQLQELSCSRFTLKWA